MKYITRTIKTVAHDAVIELKDGTLKKHRVFSTATGKDLKDEIYQSVNAVYDKPKIFGFETLPSISKIATYKIPYDIFMRYASIVETENKE